MCVALSIITSLVYSKTKVLIIHSRQFLTPATSSLLSSSGTMRDYLFPLEGTDNAFVSLPVCVFKPLV